MKNNNKLFMFLINDPKRYLYSTAAVIIFNIGLILCLFIIAENVHEIFIKSVLIIFIIGLIFIISFFYAQYILFPVYNIQKTLVSLLGENSSTLQRICICKNDTEIKSMTKDIVNGIAQSVNREYHLEVVKRQTDVATLQGQINPHFLYNTLDCIRGQALLMDAHDIADMTQALSKFFRYSISHKDDLVTVAEEIQNVENYFKIQQFRFNNRHSLTIEYDKDDEEILDCLVPKLTLQPIVENAIIHGLEPKLEQGNVNISMISTGKCLLIRCSDDGAGMNLEQLEELMTALQEDYMNVSDITSTEKRNKRHNGIAMTNVNQRIKLFFGEQYGITISSVENAGTDVDIRVPFVKKYDMNIMEKSDAAGSTQDGTNRQIL